MRRYEKRLNPASASGEVLGLLGIWVGMHLLGGCNNRLGGAGHPFYFQPHQPLRGKADHLAQEVRVRAVLKQRSQVHHIAACFAELHH
jgi:hypothetical protein